MLVACLDTVLQLYQMQLAGEPGERAHGDLSLRFLQLPVHLQLYQNTLKNVTQLSSSVNHATFQVLDSHMWPEASV